MVAIVAGIVGLHSSVIALGVDHDLRRVELDLGA
jgi:hypothetical protein